MAKGLGTRSLRVLLVAPILAFAVTASSHLAFRCSITGLLGTESCCPHEGDVGSPAPDPQASLADPGCCEHFVVATDKVPVAVSAALQLRPTFLLSWLAVPSLVAGDQCATRSQVRPVSSRALFSPAPRYLLTHSFLI